MFVLLEVLHSPLNLLTNPSSCVSLSVPVPPPTSQATVSASEQHHGQLLMATPPSAFASWGGGNRTLSASIYGSQLYISSLCLHLPDSTKCVVLACYYAIVQDSVGVAGSVGRWIRDGMRASGGYHFSTQNLPIWTNMPYAGISSSPAHLIILCEV